MEDNQKPATEKLSTLQTVLGITGFVAGVGAGIGIAIGLARRSRWEVACRIVWPGQCVGSGSHRGSYGSISAWHRADDCNCRSGVGDCRRKPSVQGLEAEKGCYTGRQT